MTTFMQELSFGPWLVGIYTNDDGTSYRTILHEDAVPAGSSSPGTLDFSDSSNSGLLLLPFGVVILA